MKTQTLKKFITSLRSTLFAASVSVLATSSLSAATMTWDPLGGGTNLNGGSGTWDTSASLWWNGAANTNWGAATTNADIARIPISGGSTISLAGTIYAGGVYFAGTGSITQILTNGTLALTGTNSTITVTNNQTGAVIRSQITGNGFQKSGPGTLVVHNGTWTGDTIVNSGNLESQANNGLSTNTALKLWAGTIRLTGVSQSFASIEGAGNITARAANGTLSVTGSRTTTFAGNITQMANTMALSVAITGAGTRLTLSGSGNDYLGSTTISAGTLVLGSHLIGTTNIVVSGGSLESSVGSVNLGVGNVNMSAGDITPGGVGTAATLVVATNKQFITTGGTLKFDLGTAFDQVTGAGANSSFNLTNTTLALTLGSGFNYTNTYQIFSGFTTSSITGLNISGHDSGAYNAALSNAGLLSFTVVPEPATMSLLLGGLGILALYRRRQQRRH